MIEKTLNFVVIVAFVACSYGAYHCQKVRTAEQAKKKEEVLLLPGLPAPSALAWKEVYRP